MPIMLDGKTPELNIDLSEIKEKLIEQFEANVPNPPRAIERCLKEIIYDKVLIGTSRHSSHISSSIKIHDHYNKQNRSLAKLTKTGLSVWYLDILTKWKNEIEFDSIQYRISGLPVMPIEYGGGITRSQNDYVKALKTQKNLKSTISQIVVPPELISDVFEYVKPIQTGLIWDSSHETIDRAHLLPHYYRNQDDKPVICSCSLNAYKQSGGIPESAVVQDEICHLCKVSNLGKDGLIDLYGTEFLSNQLPFITQIQLSSNIDRRTAIAEAARIFQTSKWKNEALLYAIIKDAFPNSTILREYAPAFLEGLRIDIYVKDINLAIEYQGEQHYRPISIFGGDDGYNGLKERDKLKMTLCKNNNIPLEFFTFKEKITSDLVRHKLSKYLGE